MIMLGIGITGSGPVVNLEKFDFVSKSEVDGKPMSSANVLVAWSGGKDSMMALRDLQFDGAPQFLTTFNETNNRSSMHGVTEELIEEQVESLGGTLHSVYLPEDCPNEVYEERMGEVLRDLSDRMIDTVVFGDLFLEDIRSYREDQMEPLDVTTSFPLWKRDTNELSRDFIQAGYAAVIVCVELDSMSEDFLGRSFDKQLLDDLPEGVDPCGENGEFHTFVYDGPDFNRPIPIESGRIENRGDYLYCDLSLMD